MMTIKAIRCNEKFLDLRDAKEGELVIVHLASHPPLILTALKSYGSMELFLKQEHAPIPLRYHVKAEIFRILGEHAKSVYEWYEQNNPNYLPLFDVLFEALTFRCYLAGPHIGQNLEVHLTDPFGSQWPIPLHSWRPETSVESFDPTEKWVGDIEAARIAASL